VAGCEVRITQDQDAVLRMRNGDSTHKNVKIKGLSWFYSKKTERIINQLQNRQIDLVEAPDWTGITLLLVQNVR
jgi:hypothetical protein